MRKRFQGLYSLFILLLFIITMTVSVFAKGVWPSTAEVSLTDGGVRLTVDGKSIIPVMSYGYLGENDYYKYYRTIEYSKYSQKCLYVISTGNDFTSEATREFWNEEVSRFLELDDDAYFIFHVSAMAGGEWTSQNHLFTDTEGELALRYDGTKSGADIGLGWFSMASETWRDRIEYNYTNGIEWLSKQPYADRIVGFQVGNATYFEWVFVNFQNENLDDYSEASKNGFRNWLREKYGTNANLQKAWCDSDVTFANAEIPTPAERFTTNDGLFHNVYEGSSKVVDYNEYYNWCYYSAIEYIAKIVHEKTDDSLLVGALYGYYFSYVATPYPVNTGAFALTNVMESENIDFLSATNFYFTSTSTLGSNRVITGVPDSLALNGKLYLTEDDTRTFLSPPVDKDGVWRASDYKETLAVLRRNFSVVAVRDQGTFFMDMDGSGWYNDSDLWEQIAEMRRLWAAMNFGATKGYSPEVALIVDDESIYYTDTDDSRVSVYTSEQLAELREAGMTYGAYLKCDIDKLPDSVKLIIMSNTFYMDEEDIKNINAHKADGKVIVFTRAPGYISEKSQSVDNISSLIGMNVSTAELLDNEMTSVTNFDHPVNTGLDIKQFGKLGKCRRAFYVDDKEATSLGVYKGTEFVSFAIKEFDNWTSIFTGSGVLKSELLRSIAKNYTDIHNYKPDGASERDSIESDGTFLCYNPASIGHKVILLPEYSHVVDNINNVNKGSSVNAITYDAAFKGDVGMFSIVPGVYSEVGVDSAEVTKSGKWETVDGALVSTTPGDTLTYAFKGTFISVIASRGYDKGVIGYTIDGVEYPDVNFHTKEELGSERCEYVLAQNLSDSEHTVVVTVKEPIEYAPETLNIKTDNPKRNTIHGDEVPLEFANAQEGVNEPLYEMGVEFQVKVPGKITKARLLAVPAESGKHTVTLYDGYGNIVAGPFEWNIKVTKTTWCEYTFKKPISIEAEKTYIMSVSKTEGRNHYVAKAQFFNDVPKDSVFILNSTSGKFNGTVGKFPTLTYNGTSYYRDLVFEFDKKLLAGEKSEKIDKNVIINGFGTVDGRDIVKVTDEERKAVVDSYVKDGIAVVKEFDGKNTAAVTAKSTSATVLVNGRQVQFEAYEIDGYNYFKLRDFAYAINGSEKQFDVTWDEGANAIGLISGSAYTVTGGELTPGDGKDKESKKTTAAVIKDGTEVSFEAYEIGGYNYFKLRDMAQAFDIGITWDEQTSTIGIDTALSYLNK